MLVHIFDKSGELTQELLDRIVERHEQEKEAAKERKKEQGPVPAIPGAAIARYFPKTYTVAQIEAEVIRLLERKTRACCPTNNAKKGLKRKSSVLFQHRNRLNY